MTRRHQRRHLKHLAGRSGPIVELGCGKGAVLELLRDMGQSAYGVDISEEAVRTCKAKGLDVRQADALSHLAGLQSNSLGGVFCAHLIEHMEARRAVELIRLAHAALAPRSRMVVVTPNPGDLRAFERFWCDPTHIRPYPSKLLCKLMTRAGFRIVETGRDREPSHSFLEWLAKGLIRCWFMGYMFVGDVFVVGEKP